MKSLIEQVIKTNQKCNVISPSELFGTAKIVFIKK